MELACNRETKRLLDQPLGSEPVGELQSVFLAGVNLEPLSLRRPMDSTSRDRLRAPHWLSCLRTVDPAEAAARVA